MATHSYDRGGQLPSVLGVSIDGDHVCVEVESGVSAAVLLTAEQALELAADLVAHANALRQPAGEERAKAGASRA